MAFCSLRMDEDFDMTHRCVGQTHNSQFDLSTFKPKAGDCIALKQSPQHEWTIQFVQRDQSSMYILGTSDADWKLVDNFNEINRWIPQQHALRHGVGLDPSIAHIGALLEDKEGVVWTVTRLVEDGLVAANEHLRQAGIQDGEVFTPLGAIKHFFVPHVAKSVDEEHVTLVGGQTSGKRQIRCGGGGKKMAKVGGRTARMKW